MRRDEVPTNMSELEQIQRYCDEDCYRGTGRDVCAHRYLRRLAKSLGLEPSQQILGDGPGRSTLEHMTRELGIADHVFFAGWIDPEKVACHLAAADIIVGPSGLEGQGLAVLEAMLADLLPVIATLSRGIVDAAQHEDTGVLVNETLPDNIAEAELRLAPDPDLAHRLGQKGTEVVHRRFTREVSARAFSNLYSTVAVGDTRKPNNRFPRLERLPAGNESGGR